MRIQEDYFTDDPLIEREYTSSHRCTKSDVMDLVVCLVESVNREDENMKKMEERMNRCEQMISVQERKTLLCKEILVEISKWKSLPINMKDKIAQIMDNL
jgi:hypothetical protein